MNRRRVLTLTGALIAGALAGCTGDTPPDGGDGPSSPGTTQDPGPPSTTGTTAKKTSPVGSKTPAGTTETPHSEPTPALRNAPEPGVVPDIGGETLAELAQNTNTLAVDLYDELVNAKPGENLLASPVSITTALSMAYAGARGETRTQMREALHYSLDDNELHAAFNALQRELNARGQDIDEGDLPSNYEPEDNPIPFQLDLVNSVWGQEGFPFREDYLSILADHYGGGLREVDYKSDPEAARQTIASGYRVRPDAEYATPPRGADVSRTNPVSPRRTPFGRREVASGDVGTARCPTLESSRFSAGRMSTSVVAARCTISPTGRGPRNPPPPVRI